MPEDEYLPRPTLITGLHVLDQSFVKHRYLLYNASGISIRGTITLITEVEDCVLIEATECSYRNRNDESDGDEWFPSDTQLLLRLPLKEHGKKHHTGELRFDVDGAAWAILPKDQLIAKQVAQVATT